LRPDKEQKIINTFFAIALPLILLAGSFAFGALYMKHKIRAEVYAGSRCSIPIGTLGITITPKEGTLLTVTDHTKELED
jgi:hypothetical protein